ncbi:DUF3305 domain-containing protein [Pseudaestuariivita rosea]|uniref:DUF3305 domain-containing protein n=1 Tax=Pseudaestuariivita rosea TaxID=2763263 RepID=UPI001ABA5961|nr:DUF3305 domain-containing protein [Pseudaestuariivita rosea]
MATAAARHAVLPVGVVLRRAPGVTRWAKWSWKAVGVLPGAKAADWSVLRSDGDITEYHAATLPLTLWASDTEAYLAALSAQVPCIYVVMRPAHDDEKPFEMVLATASPYEAQDYTDGAEDQVEKVSMPEGLVAWVRDFVEAYHEEEQFVKRRRDRKRVDLKEDGKGDARISQLSDVYRAPTVKREKMH